MCRLVETFFYQPQPVLSCRRCRARLGSSERRTNIIGWRGRRACPVPSAYCLHAASAREIKRRLGWRNSKTFWFRIIRKRGASAVSCLQSSERSLSKDKPCYLSHALTSLIFSASSLCALAARAEFKTHAQLKWIKNQLSSLNPNLSPQRLELAAGEVTKVLKRLTLWQQWHSESSR